MATHSSVLAWRDPGMGEPGGLPSMGSHGQAHSVGPTVLTQLGEVHPEVPHSFFPFFLKTIVSSVTRQGIHRLKRPGLWKAPVKGRSSLVPP